jgi:hypothetical protein
MHTRGKSCQLSAFSSQLKDKKPGNLALETSSSKVGAIALSLLFFKKLKAES